MQRVDLDHRRRLLVERQLLGPTGRAERSLDEVVDALSLLHSTDPATPYLMLHARTDCSIADVDAAFYERRSLVRHTCIRRTIFAMPLDAARAAHGAATATVAAKLRTQLLAWLVSSDDVDVDAERFLRRTEERVVEHLSSVGPSTGNQLATAIDELQARFDPMPGKSYSKPQRITSKVLELLAADGRVARARPTGADLTSGSWTWAVTGDWFDHRIDLTNAAPAAEALADLLGRHLWAFGPATVTDMTWWTGLTKGRVRAALSAIGAVDVEVDSATEPAFVLADDDLDVAVSADPSVALLPGLDSTTMGWKQRSWYVDDAASAGIFDRNGNAGPTVWVDGRVVGAWSQRSDGSVGVELVEQVGSTADDAIRVEADRIAAWLGDVRVNWRYPTAASKRVSAG